MILGVCQALVDWTRNLTLVSLEKAFIHLFLNWPIHSGLPEIFLVLGTQCSLSWEPYWSQAMSPYSIHSLHSFIKKKKKKITEQLPYTRHYTRHWRIKKNFDKVPDLGEFTEKWVQKDTNTQQKNWANYTTKQSSNAVCFHHKNIEHTCKYSLSINYTLVHNIRAKTRWHYEVPGIVLSSL